MKHSDLAVESAHIPAGTSGTRCVSRTIGGVKINEKMEVISEDGEVIPGLYCIGADAGGFYAEHYNFLDSGCASSFSFLSGKTAAESITEALTGEKVSDEWTDHDASMQAVADIIGYDLNQ